MLFFRTHMNRSPRTRTMKEKDGVIRQELFLTPVLKRKSQNRRESHGGPKRRDRMVLTPQRAGCAATEDPLRPNSGISPGGTRCTHRSQKRRPHSIVNVRSNRGQKRRPHNIVNVRSKRGGGKTRGGSKPACPSHGSSWTTPRSPSSRRRTIANSPVSRCTGARSNTTNRI